MQYFLISKYIRKLQLLKWCGVVLTSNRRMNQRNRAEDSAINLHNCYLTVASRKHWEKQQPFWEVLGMLEVPLSKSRLWVSNIAHKKTCNWPAWPCHDFIKFPEGSIDENLHGLGLGNNFMDMIPKAQAVRAEIAKWQTENLLHNKGREPTEWGEMWHAWLCSPKKTTQKAKMSIGED